MDCSVINSDALHLRNSNVAEAAARIHYTLRLSEIITSRLWGNILKIMKMQYAYFVMCINAHFAKKYFFLRQFHPFVNDFLDFSKLTKSLYYQLLSVKGDNDTEKGGSVSSFERVRVMHVLKKKDWSCIAVGFIWVSV